MSLGLPRKTVQLVSYSATWPSIFEQERAWLKERITLSGIAIEHVGSTAVPGLVAKPIIDIAIAVESISQITDWEHRLSPEYAYYGNRALPDDWLFVKGPEACRQVYLHAVLKDSQRWRNYLHFRDQLQASPELRESYAELKRELSRRFPKDRGAYTQGKASFIQEVLKTAPQSP